MFEDSRSSFSSILYYKDIIFKRIIYQIYIYKSFKGFDFFKYFQIFVNISIPLPNCTLNGLYLPFTKYNIYFEYD